MITPQSPRPRQRWIIWSLDEWGNGKDGWEFNDRSKSGSIMLPEDPSDDEVFKALKAEGWLKPHLRRTSIEIGGDDQVMTIEDARVPSNYEYGWGQPIYSVELEND